MSNQPPGTPLDPVALTLAIWLGLIAGSAGLLRLLPAPAGPVLAELGQHLRR